MVYDAPATAPQMHADIAELHPARPFQGPRTENRVRDVRTARRSGTPTILQHAVPLSVPACTQWIPMRTIVVSSACLLAKPTGRRRIVGGACGCRRCFLSQPGRHATARLIFSKKAFYPFLEARLQRSGGDGRSTPQKAVFMPSVGRGG